MYAAGYATKPRTPLRSDRALRHVYRWALVLVAALAVMLAPSRIAHGIGASSTVGVQPGDTLWPTAAARYPADDTRMRAVEPAHLNRLSSPMMTPAEVHPL